MPVKKDVAEVAPGTLGGYPDRVLSALDDHIAVLDRQGNITQVNESWTRFAQANGATPGSTDVGANYLEICRVSLGPDPQVQQVLTGIQAVLDGSVPRFRSEYRCDSPTQGRWFALTVNPLPKPEGGAVVCHSDISALRKAKDEHAALLEVVHAIVWRAEVPTFQTTFASKQAETILGYPVENWLKQPGFWKEHIHPEDRDWVIALTTKATQDKRSHDFEYRMIAADGKTVWLRNIVNVVVENGQARELVGVTVDIRKRKRAEHALRESEERFRLVANTAPVLIWMAGPDKLCNYFNQRWLEFTGRPFEAELGNGWSEGVHPEDLKLCLKTYLKAFDRRESFQMQYRLRRHDGEYRWMLDIGVPRFNADGSLAGYIGSCVDITDRKLAEEALADVGRRLIEAHEEERTWVARELHDDINQRIALLAFDLENCDQHLPQSATTSRNHIYQARQRLSDIGTDIQALSHRLHSSKLDYLGIAVAAGSFCKELSEQQNIEIEFSHAGIPDNVPKEIALCLFRVLQEALQNAVKYSGARHFRVELSEASGEIQLTVNDLGIGFDPLEAMTRRGLGLISMHERMQLVNGELSINSAPGRGTTVNARVPLTAKCIVPDLLAKSHTA